MLYLLDHDGEKVKIKCYFHNLKFDPLNFLGVIYLKMYAAMDVTGIKPMI